VRQALWLTLVLVMPTAAQIAQWPSQQPIDRSPSQRGNNFPNQDRDSDPAFAEKTLRALNAQRQKSMVADADKLLKLASELKAEIDSGNSESLTPTQLKKLETIEKLAHSVKDKMSTSVRGVPASPPPLIRADQ
jgi:uncharacterized protein with WD repeat